MNPLKWLLNNRNGKSSRRHNVMEVSDDGFQTQVIRRSYKQTVMVDYWASWCSPCRILGPVLERMAQEADSPFVLAKLDTEANPKMAARYQIRSIPAIKVFRNGQVVGEFTGLMPEHNIRKFMREINGKAAPPPRIKVPDQPAEQLRQGKLHLKKGRGVEAFVLLAGIDSEPQLQEAQLLLPLARFLFDVEDGDWPSGTAELDTHYVAAAKALTKGDAKGAVSQLQQCLKAGPAAPVSETEAVLDALFALLGDDHPVTKAHRDQVVVS